MAKDTISYWNGNGKYNDDYTRLWNALVPDSGEAETIEGELIRAIGRLVYEYSNNGNCNSAEQIQETCSECKGAGYYEESEYEECEGSEIYTVDCSWCDGSGLVVKGMKLNKMYEKFLFLIEEKVGCSSEVGAVVNLITDKNSNHNYKYNQEEMDVYNALCDKVIEYVIEKEKTGFTKLK